MERGFDENESGSHSKMVRLVGNNKRVLEIGCGIGAVTERLKRNGCTVCAIELNAKDAKLAKEFCDQIDVGNIETINLKFPKKSFDVITFGDVLEHLYDPQATLERIKPFLKDDGLVITSIPNIANWKIRLKLLFGKFDYTDHGILDKTHVKFFTRKTARELFESAGYEIVKSDYVRSFPSPILKNQLSKINTNLFAFQFLFAAKKKGVR